MNATEFAATAAALERTFAEVGLVIERAEQPAGRLIYQRVSAESLLGRIMQMGWRVTLAKRDPPAPPLTLLDDDDGA